MHVCCAPCFVAPYYDLIKSGQSVSAFWYNPNIHPFTEYKARLTTLRDFTDREGIEMVCRDDYDLEGFLTMAISSDSKRCEGCYRLRIEACAKTAAERGYGAFSSTLLYSRYQKHELIREIAEEMAHQYNVKFYYADFRQLWQQGIDLSKEQEMYRQKYCGCIFSERDRYQKSKGQ